MAVLVGAVGVTAQHAGILQEPGHLVVREQMQVWPVGSLAHRSAQGLLEFFHALDEGIEFVSGVGGPAAGDVAAVARETRARIE